MAVRAAVQYIGQYVLRELGLATYVPASVAAAATSMRVMDISIFDPAGGQCFVEDSDALITYTSIQDDSLSGIPSSGTGSIAATINEYTNASRDLIVRADLISAYELERFIDRHRVWIEPPLEAFPDVEKKRYSCARGWFDTGVSLRDSNGSTYNSVTADTINYENGTFEFTSARTNSLLYVAGWGYNPYLTIADIIETIAHDRRWSKYSQIGQMSEVQTAAGELANVYRARGSVLSFIS